MTLVLLALAGLVVGVVIGVAVMAMLTAGSRDDDMHGRG